MGPLSGCEVRMSATTLPAILANDAINKVKMALGNCRFVAHMGHEAACEGAFR